MLCRFIRYSYIYEARMSSALNGSSTIQHFKGSDAIEIHDGITFDFYTGLPRMHSTCIPKPTESHQTLPSPCVIPKAIRAGGDWVWLARVVWITYSVEGEGCSLFFTDYTRVEKVEYPSLVPRPAFSPVRNIRAQSFFEWAWGQS